MKPPKVEASPFTLPDGREIRGGYYPLIADPEATIQGRKDFEERHSLKGFGAELHDILKMYSTRERLKFFNKQYIPEIGKSFSLSGRLSFALNWGNEGNREALLATYSEDQVQAVLRTLQIVTGKLLEKEL